MLMDQVAMENFQKEKQEEDAKHDPVMLDEVIEYLNPKPGNVFVDGTIGLGGHAEVVLSLIGARGRLIGIDQDDQALAVARKNLAAKQGQCEFVHENYTCIDKVLAELEIEEVDGILLDLGASSLQMDSPKRGFGFRVEGPLDMRMNQRNPVTAFDLVNALSEKEISAILKDYGQERWHHRIARAIVAHRSKNPIETTQELSHIVLKAMPRHSKREKIHPATRTFQAFRIAVNRELEGLEGALEKCVRHLRVGGRIAVISFHSLEDRIVKVQFRDMAKAGKIELIVKKPLRPSEGEIQLNPRARSARLRIAERLAS